MTTAPARRLLPVEAPARSIQHGVEHGDLSALLPSRSNGRFEDEPRTLAQRAWLLIRGPM